MLCITYNKGKGREGERERGIEGFCLLSVYIKALRKTQTFQRVLCYVQASMELSWGLKMCPY